MAVAFGELAGATATATAPDPIERRYALRLVKQRLHQAAFRDLVLAAYDHRCAISNLPNLPDDHLLDAAHIMADAHELLGQPVVANGIALSRTHHAAFDNLLIGIDPDGRVHVSERLLMLHDGPLLKQSLKACAGVSDPDSEGPAVCPGSRPACDPVRAVQRVAKGAAALSAINCTGRRRRRAGRGYEKAKPATRPAPSHVARAEGVSSALWLPRPARTQTPRGV